jgi:hypothetical protein
MPGVAENDLRELREMMWRQSQTMQKKGYLFQSRRSVLEATRHNE